jgi:hypothetical protein
MTNPTEITIQEKLIQIDSIIQTLEILKEQITQRRDTILSEENLQNMITAILKQEEFTKPLANAMVNQIGQTAIIRSMTKEVKAAFEEHIDSYISTQLSEPYMLARMGKLIDHVTQGGNFQGLQIEPEEPKLEDLSFNDPGDISKMMKILAGADAVS